MTQTGFESLEKIFLSTKKTEKEFFRFKPIEVNISKSFLFKKNDNLFTILLSCSLGAEDEWSLYDLEKKAEGFLVKFTTIEVSVDPLGKCYGHLSNDTEFQFEYRKPSDS